MAGLDVVLQEERKVCIRVARRFLRDKSLAEDVAQDALMAMVVRLEEFVSEAHRMAWLHVVARNRAISENRRRHADVLGLQPGEDGRSVRARLGVGHRQEVRLDHLKYEQRQVIEMHYLRGMTAQEIAAGLKLSVETVRTRLRRSLRLLRTGVPRG